MIDVNGKYEVIQQAPYRYTLKFDDVNRHGETIVIEVVARIDNFKDRESQVREWYKLGYTKSILKTDLWINTEVTDSKGNIYSKYNPTKTTSHQINFDLMLEATKENAIYLINLVLEEFREG